MKYYNPVLLEDYIVKYEILIDASSIYKFLNYRIYMSTVVKEVKKL